MSTGDGTTTATAGPELTPDALRLEQCPRCGYMLQGLPSRGVCPECGREYDDQTVVLYGWADGSRGDAFTGTPGVAFVMLGVGCFQILNSLFGFLRTRSPAAFIGVAIWAALIAYVCWRRWGSHMPGLIQVHISPDGCRQLANQDVEHPPQFSHWSQIDRVTIEPKGDGRWRISLRRQRPWWKLQSAPVDAVVRCTAEQGESLRRRVAEWRERHAW